MENSILYSTDKFEEAKIYWLNKLNNELSTIFLEPDCLSSTQKKFSIYNMELDINKKNIVLKLTNDNILSRYIFFATTLKILLYKFIGDNETLLVSPVYNQSQQKLNKYVIIKDKIEEGITFKDFLISVKNSTIEAYKYQFYSVKKVYENLGINADKFPLRFILFDPALHNQINDDELMEVGNDFFVSIVANKNDLKLSIKYNSNLYTSDFLRNFEKRYLLIFDQIVSNFNIKISEIEIVTKDEKDDFLRAINSNFNSEDNASIIDLFENQVKLSSDTVVANFKDKNITYSELDRRSDFLASILKSKGALQNSIVGILASRSIEMLIGILGILKSGAAYLPIDIEYPLERIKYILKDSGAKLLFLAQENIVDTSSLDVEIIYHNELLNQGELTNFSKYKVSSDNLAYVIYTSGSTGKPKGVLIEHKSIVNTLLWRKKYYSFDKNETILQIPSYIFDSSVEDIFTPIISGSKLVFIDQLKKNDTFHIINEIDKKNATNFLITPNFYRIILKETNALVNLKSLRTITVAGEHFSNELINEHFFKLPNCDLFNEYGPTENSVCSTVYKIINVNSKILIGKPINGVNCFIMDKYLRFLPQGFCGELLVSGNGLAIGYLNNVELTAEKFIHNSEFNRIYLTGDIVRSDYDGNIEFIGRKDDQIKIRGYRIELSEIEKLLLKHDEVKNAFVTVKSGNKEEKVICAYYISDISLTRESLISYLLKYIPEYMLPNHFIQIDKMPLLLNGKINKNALPEPSIRKTENFIKPRNSMEETLVKIWADVLGIDPDLISINSNFFELGGHSLSLNTVISKINREYNVGLPLLEIYNSPTIELIGKVIDLVSLKRNEKENLNPSIKRIRI